MAFNAHFPQISLNSDLIVQRSASGRKTLGRTDSNITLPSQPRVSLKGDMLLEHLRKAFLVHELDALSPYLWVIATPHEAHITPLHQQEARSRRVIVSEHPGLHAIWYYDRIFLKPIPPYLLSQAFWEYAEEADAEVWKAAAGFMRTYCYLIRYEVDFRKATSPELHLIPQIDGRKSITFEEFIEFISQFEHLENREVCPRYSYGSIRLSRLNYLAFLLGKFSYFHMHGQWRDFFGHLFAPFITFFIVVSTILSSLQVALAAQTIDASISSPLLVRVSWWFSIVVLLLVATIVSIFAIFIITLVFKDQYFGLTMMKARQKDELKAREMTSAVIR
ncbi:hypothetical protein F5Y19DRAFT_327422 [Xylariaceae sp. FL1651]|nr:hypothetical protein F5Y19DRAFT_327422 [Xylariaceae sp. FL1651]